MSELRNRKLGQSDQDDGQGNEISKKSEVVVEDMPKTKKPKSNSFQKLPEEEVKRRLGIAFALIISTVVIAVGTFFYFMFTRMGVGQDFPSQPFDTAEPLLPSSVLDVMATLSIPPGNIAVSSDGTIYFNFHPEYETFGIKIAKVVPKDSASNPTANDKKNPEEFSNITPFPSFEFQSVFKSVLSMRIDSQDRLWLLDYAKYAFTCSPTLYGFQLNTATNGPAESIVNYTFSSSVAGMGSMLNDFVVDPKGGYIYIADTSILAATPAILVFDINQRTSVRILSGQPSLFGLSAFIIIEKLPVAAGWFGMRINVDSIALSRDGSTLYFGALTGNTLYSVPSALLQSVTESIAMAGRSASNAEEDSYIMQSVVVVSDEKPMTDGLTSDNNGNIWMTALQQSSIAVAVPNGDGKAIIKKVVRDPTLIRWPDGMSFGPDGIYFTNSVLHKKLASGAALMDAKREMRYSKNDMRAEKQAISWTELHGPFHILRIKSSYIKDLVGETTPVAGQ